MTRAGAGTKHREGYDGVRLLPDSETIGVTAISSSLFPSRIHHYITCVAAGMYKSHEKHGSVHQAATYPRRLLYTQVLQLADHESPTPLRTGLVRDTAYRLTFVSHLSDHATMDIQTCVLRIAVGRLV